MGPGCWSKESAEFLLPILAQMALAQFELEGGYLHGIQADGGVIGQRRVRVHQGERHGLEQLQVQILEQS